MKRTRFLTLTLAAALLLVASCAEPIDPVVKHEGGGSGSQSGKETPSQPGTTTDSTIVVGVCKSGMTSTTQGYYKKCLGDAGAKVVFFEKYADPALATEYVGQVDAVIIPGSTANDTTGRSTYDNNIIREAIAKGKPMLGICYGHQRINVVKGGKTTAVTETYPNSTVQHKITDGSTNVGLNTLAHKISIDTTSTLYKLLGNSTLMVNTSHNYCTSTMAAGLKVVARADDGLVEAYEGTNVMGVQFHPEVLYGKMGISIHLEIFKNLVSQAKSVKFKK